VPPVPEVVGRWGARPNPSESFLVIVTGQQGTTLQGTLTVQPEGGQSVTGMLVNSAIQGNTVILHAQIGSVLYNFTLTRSGDGRYLIGSWSTSNMGLLQPITFERLLI
jgi:hypothetical protein